MYEIIKSPWEKLFYSKRDAKRHVYLASPYIIYDSLINSSNTIEGQILDTLILQTSAFQQRCF